MALSVGIYISLQKQCEMDHNTKFNKNLKFGIVDHLGTLWLKRWLKTPKKSTFHPSNNLSFQAGVDMEVFVQSSAEMCLRIFEMITDFAKSD